MYNSGWRTARLRRILPLASCFLGLLVIHFTIFRNHWLAREWFPYDFPAGYYGTVAYWVASLQSGEWPQWIPYQSMGYPLLMNPQAGFFYPPFWVFVIFHIPFTLHAAVVVQILHVLFGAVGFLLLAKRLFGSLLAAECGAAAFLLFGGFYSNAEHADIIRGFAWIPWLLLAALHYGPRLKCQNLALPGILACFITGAYTGQVIAGLLLLAIFITIQAAQLFLRTRERFVLRNLVLQFALMGVGVLIASDFLLTAAGLAGELTRAHDVAALVPIFLPAKSVFDLLFPSNLIHPTIDYSMSGMQLPVVLLLFLPLIELNFLKRLIPFLALGAFGAMMCFDTFARISNGLRHVFPVLALSRFPCADYREFVYLAALLLATGGLASAIRDGSAYWRKTAALLLVAAIFGAVCLTCLQHDIAPASIRAFLQLAKGQILILLGTTILFFLCCRWGKPAIAALLLLPLMVVTMLPILDSEKQFWANPYVLRDVYDGQGRPLEVHGQLRTRAIFSRHDAQRGPRAVADNVRLPSWWGYLDGAYLTNDSGHVIPLTRQTAELDPAVMRFILQGSQILEVPCASDNAACSAEDPSVNLSGRAPAGVPLEYSRNFLSYEIELPARSLVIENEMAIRGWHISIDGKETPMRKVNGCLRGWVAPAGKHQVRLRYRTPWLIPSLLLSAAGLVAWIAAVWYLVPAFRFRIPAADCVILVSSDRTGG